MTHDAAMAVSHAREAAWNAASALDALAAALRVASGVRDAVIVFVVCDRGDRYLSTGVFPA